MLRFLKNALLIVTIASLSAVVATIRIGDYYAARAAYVQRVEVPNAAEVQFTLGSENARPVGPPQTMIILDRKAFLPGLSNRGAQFVNDTYLRRHNIAPLAMSDLSDLLSSALMGLFTVAMISLVCWLLLILRRSDGGTMTA